MNPLPTAQGGSATFVLSFYEQSKNQTLEATTVCDVGGCNENEQVLPSSQTTVTIASMGVKNLLFHPTSTPLPIVIRTQSHDLSCTSEDAKERMLRDVQDFISGLNTYDLVRFAESRNH